MEESAKKYHEHSTTWVKAWIGVGVAGIVLSIVFLLVLGVYVDAELQRKADCDAGTRQDCASSLVWALEGINDETNLSSDAEQDALKQEAEEKLSVEYERGIRHYRTDNGSPQVGGVEIGGAEYTENWYVADAGSALEIVIRPEGDFDHAELYVHPQATLTPGVGIHEGSFLPQSDGTYVATYRLPARFEGDLEARVSSGADSYGSAFIQVKVR